MNENGNADENTKTITQANPRIVALWKAYSLRIPSRHIKAYQPIIGKEGLRRLFKTKTSADNYALAIRMRYVKLLNCMEN